MGHILEAGGSSFDKGECTVLTIWSLKGFNKCQAPGKLTGCGDNFAHLEPVSRKPRKLFGPAKPFLVHLYLKSEKCMRLKLLV